MSRLSITTPTTADHLTDPLLTAFVKRLSALPPGICPLSLLEAFSATAALQSCGKCVPCRDGLPRITELIRKITAGPADENDLEELRTLAELLKDASDCALGWEAGRIILENLDNLASAFSARLAPAVASVRRQTVPCETLCPAHVDIPGYIALTATGRTADAVALIRRDNPFPTACAFVCEHPCEKRCRRGLIDAPVNIRAVKRFAVDQSPADKVALPAKLPATGRKVAVIGAGAAGLSCAYFLALMGHTVDVFEEKKQPGGMMRYGIPAYRFPRERLDEDIRAILSLDNITLHTNSPVGTEQFKALQATHDAVFVAIGAHTGKKLSIPGSDAPNVLSAVDLLRTIGDGAVPDFSGKRVAVIGGGNVAMDCVRTAVRAGATEVNLVYRRRVEDMTALKEEIDAAIAEGVDMLPLMSPVAIEKDTAGNAAALVLQPQMISSYVRGRPAPVNAAKPTVKLAADLILIAVSQDIVSAPFENAGLAARRGAFTADTTLATNLPHVFAGGDCQTGPTTVIRAIAAGRVAARNIDEMLGFHHSLAVNVTIPVGEAPLRTPTGRINLAERPVRLRKHDFEGTEVGMSAEEARQECRRCLRCDCFGCGSTVAGRVQYA